MGNENQLYYVDKHKELFTGPFLEVGSKNYGNTQPVRFFFDEKWKYVGVDLSDGQGVDIVLDLTADFKEVDKMLGSERFGTIICFSVLEHCSQPFFMAENLTKLMKQTGKIIISVPFSWAYHAYPSDYWRFSHEGIKQLFPKLTFDPRYIMSSTPVYKEFDTIDDDVGKISFSFSSHFKKGNMIRGISARMIKNLSKIGFLRWLGKYKHVMAPTMINMIGELESND